jgi:NADH-quinone oxidoreductase subunit H
MDILLTLIIIALVLFVLLTVDAYLVLLERKVAAWVQDRIGPNRCGFDLGQPELKKLFRGFRFWGLGQPLADGLKFALKEQVIQAHVNRVLYLLAPAVSVFTTLLAFAVVPFGDTAHGRYVIAPNVDIGIVWIFAVSSLAIYAVILGGWASNNKYSFLGALRSSAQIVSYEIPLGMSILGVALLTGSLNLERIIDHQAAAGILGWNFWVQPLAFLIFLSSAMAECNRVPFDLPEAEQELIGGYHTEYSGIKFLMFFVGEYVHVITISALMSILFFGGWHFPWIATPDSAYAGAGIVKLLVLAGKIAVFIMLIMVIRWTIPRFRFDQLMSLAWKTLMPLALGNLLIAMLVKQFNLSPWFMLPASVILFVGAGWLALIAPARRGQLTTGQGREVSVAPGTASG